MDSEESFCSVKRTMEASIPNVGSDDEESFVVLGTSSFNEEDIEGSPSDEVLPPLRTGKVHDMQNVIKMELSQMNNSTPLPEMPLAVDTIDTLSSSVATITLSSESSHEEIQKKVEEVIKENEKLKNVVAQNNLSMKAHYEKILAWKEEVNQVVKSYRDKFVEAKNYIEKCKEENNKLANDVEKYKKIKELQDEEIIMLKSREKEFYKEERGDDFVEKIKLQSQMAKKTIDELREQLTEANRKGAELKEENEKLKLQLVSNIDEQVQAKDDEIKKLQVEIEQSRQQIIKLKNAIDSMQHEMEIEKARLTEENAKLTQKLASVSSVDEQLQIKDEEIMNLLRANELNNKQIVKLKNQKENLEKELNAEKEKNKLAESSISTVSLAESKLKSNEMKIAQLEQENSSLKERMNTLQYALNVKIALEEKHVQLQEQLTQTQKTVTALEEERKKNVREIEELRQLLQNSPKNDDMFALKEQLNVYKNDFEAEKESRDAIKRERDQIAEDLKNLQKRNKQLQNEIETMRARAQPPSKTEGFVCPKCNFGFNSYQSLENHVHRCLDLDAFP